MRRGEAAAIVEEIKSDRPRLIDIDDENIIVEQVADGQNIVHQM